MDDDETSEALLEQGREVGRAIQARIAANGREASGYQRPRCFPRRADRLPEDWPRYNTDLVDGYWRFMLAKERRVLDEARERIAESREGWRREYLDLIEARLERETDPVVVSFIKADIRKLRRALGIKPSSETVREQTRLRAQKHRAKRRTKAKP